MLILSIVFLAFVLFINLATQNESSNLGAFPKPPQVMYGKIFFQNGSLVPKDYLIEARVSGIHYAQKVNTLGGYSMETRTHSVSNGYNYGVSENFQICADNSATLSAIEGAQQDDQIEFYIEGTQATVMRPGIDETTRSSIPFNSGTVVNADIYLAINSLSAGSFTTDNIISPNVCEDIWGTPTATPIGTATPTPTRTPRTAATYVPTATPQGQNGDSGNNSTNNGGSTASASGGSGAGGGGGGGGGFTVPSTSTPVSAAPVTVAVLKPAKSSLIPPTPTPIIKPTATPFIAPTATPVLAQIKRGSPVPINIPTESSDEENGDIDPTPTPTPYPTRTPEPIEITQQLIKNVASVTTEEALDVIEKEDAENVAIVMEEVAVSQAAEIVEEIDSDRAADIVSRVESEKAAAIVENVDSQKAADIVGKVESEKAADIVQSVDSAKAADIVSKVDTKKAAAIVDKVEATKAAEIIGDVDDEKAADIVEKVQISKAAAIVENVLASKAAEIVKKVETVKAAEIVSNVESSKAAAIVEKVESTKAAEIVERVESSKAAKIVSVVETVKAAEIVEKVESAKAAEIVQNVGSFKAGAIVEKVNTIKAAEIVEKIESAKAAEIVENLGSQKAADIVKSVSTNKAADIVKSVESSKAAEIVEKVESGTAAGIVEKVESKKAAEIVEKVESKKAAEIVEKVGSTKAAGIVEKVESKKAAEIVEKVESKKAAEIVEKVEIKKTVQILTEIGNSQVGRILDAVTSGKVSQVVAGMEEQTLVKKLPEMTASKMFGVSSVVLLKALPNVSSEQLVSEVQPMKDIRLPEPIPSILSENKVSYSVPVTVIQNWTKLVGSPRPIEEILVRFNKELPDVQILIESLEAPTHEMNSVCEGFAVYSSFRATLKNAHQSSINTAHLKVYVEKEWMIKHGIHKWSISGHVFDEESNSWTQFPSKRISEDEANIYYTFSLPKLGELGISGCSSVPPSRFLTRDLGFTLQKSETGQSLLVKGTVENIGLEDSNYVSVLWVNKSAEMSQSIFVPAGEAAQIEFEWIAEPGLQNIRIDRLQGDIQIKPLLLSQLSAGGGLMSILIYFLVALVSLSLGILGLRFMMTKKPR